MRDAFTPDDRELLLDLLTKTTVIRHQLSQLEDELELDSDTQSAVMHTAFKAHDLMMSIRTHLID